MKYTVGFDLGTHQTKICIQDSENANDKIYEFMEFLMPDGSTTPLYPSLVQINKDLSVSYGFVDDSDCLVLCGTDETEPQLILKEIPEHPQYPKRPKPKYPKEPIIEDWKEKLCAIRNPGKKESEHDKWVKECIKIDQNSDKQYRKICAEIDLRHAKEVAVIEEENKRIRLKYEADYRDWAKENTTEKCVFRYFKLKALTGVGTWEHLRFTPEEITVWYIANLLHKIKDHYGDVDTIQFGVPTGGSSSDKDKAISINAYSLFIAAKNLSDCFQSQSEFLSATYLKLKELTGEIKRVTPEVIDQYAFDDFPEAYAGLFSITSQRKLGPGFHVLVDIGGGTTDMALFCINNKTLAPNVNNLHSFTEGLNFILENSNDRKYSLSELQNQFMGGLRNKLFGKAIELYTEHLDKEGNVLIKTLKEAFMMQKHHHGRNLGELEKAIDSQNIIYSGGGSIYNELMIPFEYFNKKRRIDKGLLSIPNLINAGHIKEELYPILSVAYGLCSIDKGFESTIECTDIYTAFTKFLPMKTSSKDPYSYEHGLSDY